MRAVYLKAPFQYAIREVPVRNVAEDEVKVKIKACGFCGTDYTSAASKALAWEPVGHEISGVVEAVGDRVLHVKAGDCVVLETSTFCRTCDSCRNGRIDLCSKGPNFWGETSLGFAEYIVVPKECVVPFTGLSFPEAALIEPLGVALDLVHTAAIELGTSVLVVGAGAIGLMAIRLAKLMGAGKIYAAVHSHSRRKVELAVQLGADEIIYTDKVQLEDYFSNRPGVERVLVTAPPRTIDSAMKAARIGGIIAYIGIEYGAGAIISFDANDFHFRKLQLRGSMAAPALYFPKSIELLQSGVMDVTALISHTFPLEHFGQYLSMIRDDKSNVIKMVMIND